MNLQLLILGRQQIIDILIVQLHKATNISLVCRVSTTGHFPSLRFPSPGPIVFSYEGGDGIVKVPELLVLPC